MKRKKLLSCLYEICSEIATEKAYHTYSEYDLDCGIWDDKKFIGANKPMSEEIKEKYGETVEYKFHAGNPKDCYVGVRFRFSNPCLHIQYRNEDGYQCMASLEFSDSKLKDGEWTHSGEYELSESLFWRAEGFALGNMLLEKCREKGISVGKEKL